MEHSVRYNFLMSQLTHIEDIKDTPKTKISVVYHNELKTSCILRMCKNRDLSAVYNLLRGVQNLNTVFVHDFVYENGDTYILEECVSGSTVQEYLELDGTISERDTAKIIIEVCKALETLHNQSPPIVHNDINPSNIMIREDGSIKLFDFDISRTYKKGQSQNTELFGTEEYAAPEHFGYGQSEPRTDIYCLGVTMHKMLTGQGLSAEHRIIYTGKLKKIIKKCLEFDPKNRYNSVLELKKDLERFLSKKLYIFRNMLLLIGFVAVVVAALFLYNAYRENDTHRLTNDSGSSTTQLENNNGNVGDVISTDSESESDVNQDSSNESTNNQENVEIEQPNNSRETAKTISFAQKQAGAVEEGGSDWYKFITTYDNSIYRISVSPIEAPANMLFPCLQVALYDTNGIKLEEFNVWSDEKQGFLDLHLESNTEYFIKINLGGRYDTGHYEIFVSEMICDAGTDRESARELKLSNSHGAVLDSTLSDWYVFQVPEDGEYNYIIHNIDVGCDIYFSIQKPRSGGEGNSIKNEDNYSGTIENVRKGELVYFEIRAYNKNSEANGKYIIIIEKS